MSEATKNAKTWRPVENAGKRGHHFGCRVAGQRELRSRSSGDVVEEGHQGRLHVALHLQLDAAQISRVPDGGSELKPKKRACFRGGAATSRGWTARNQVPISAGGCRR